MKLNAIKALCAGGKRATVLDAGPGGQWISNGFGAWLVEDIRIENAAALISIWNLSEKARKKALIMVRPTTSPRFNWMQTEGEEDLTELGAISTSDEEQYIALMSPSAGVMFIDAAMLTPVRGDYRMYRARWDDEGKPTVAVYDDLTRCVALIRTTSTAMGEVLRHTAEKITCREVYRWPEDNSENAAAEAEADAERIAREMGMDGEREA